MAVRRAPSSRRRRDRRRIRRATTALALAAATATAVFGLAAAHTPRVSSTPSASGTRAAGDGESSLGAERDDVAPVLAPSQSPPAPSFGVPAAQSGGS
jgi:hypothetical protein